MRRLIHPFLPVLLLTLFTLGGCALKSQDSLDEDPSRSSRALAEGDTDYSCSYFYFLWGRHSELLLHFEEALDAYQKALICDDQAEYISEKVPLLLLRLERTDEAAQWLNQYLQTRPDKTGMRMLYAKVLLRQKKTADALRQYQVISDRHPDDPAILLQLAELYMASQQPDKAAPLLSRVLENDPSSYPGHVLAARLAFLQGDVDGSLAHYGKALERNWSGELQMELSEVLIKSGRYDEAATNYKEIIERESDNEGARIALIHVYLLQKKDDQALAELNQLKNYVDQPQRVDLTIARLYAKQKHFDKAIAILEKILARENLPEARYFLALLYVQQGRYERSLKQVRQIDRKAPEYPEALSLEVRILREQNKAEEARRLLEANIEGQGARSPEMFLLLAALHEEEGREDQSKKVLLKGLELFPDDENLLYEYGIALENSGDHSGALTVMQRIIELKPNHAAALNFVGYSWADKEVNLDQALDYIQRAIELKPDNGFIRDSLGWVYFRLGRIDLAIKELEAAARLSPGDAAILDHLGDVYLASGRVREALETYRKALKSAKEDQEQRRRLLEKIRLLEKPGKR